MYVSAPFDVVYHLIFGSLEAFLVDGRQALLQDVRAIVVSAFESALLPFLFLHCFLVGYFSHTRTHAPKNTHAGGTTNARGCSPHHKGHLSLREVMQPF